MFDLRLFVKTNLIDGYRNGSFTREQVNIFSANYMLKGVITEQDVVEISNAMSDQEDPVV